MSRHPFLPLMQPLRSARRPAAALARMAGAALLAWGAATAAHAQAAPGAPGADATADLGGITQRWLDDALQRTQMSGTGALPLRMEVSVGQLDSRLRLAPCARVEPYLPAGSRLWGRTRLGLRCVEGPTAWNVFLPVTVKAYGPAWVLTGNVASGAVLTEADATQAEVDWAAETTAIVANPENWVGQVASRQLMAGQALRQHMVKAPTLFRAGSPVRVVAQGRGYSVTSAGQAVTNGSVGETVRVRMDNGKIIAGIVSNDGTVEVAL